MNNNRSKFFAVDVAWGSIYLLVNIVVSNFVGFLGLAFLVRLIPLKDVGILVSLLLIASILQLLSDFGLSPSLTKFVSEFDGKRVNFASTVVSAVLFKLFVTSFFSCLLFLFSDFFSKFLFGSSSYGVLFKLLAIDLIPFALIPLLNNVLGGLGKLKRISIVGITSVVIRWIVIIFFLLRGWSLAGVVVGWIIGDSLCLFLLFLSLFRFNAFRLCSFSEFRSTLTHLLRFSWLLFINSAVVFLYTWYDRALVFAFFSLSDLAVYHVAFTVFSFMVAITDALRRALLPYIGFSYGRNDHDAVRIGVKKASRYTMFIIFPLALSLAALSRPLIMILAGEQYISGWVILTVLALFGLIYGVYVPVRNILLVYGRTRLIILKTLLSVGSSMILLLFMAYFGFVGLAVVRGVALVLSALLSFYFVKRITNAEIDREVLTKVLFSAIFMALILLVAQLTYFDVYALPFYLVLGFFVYMICLKAFNTFNKEDILFFKQFFGEKFGRLIEVLVS